MQKYELTVLIKSGQISEAKDKFVARMEKVIKAVGGSVGKMTEMGNKQLAYKIQNQIEADFANWALELPSSGVVELRKKLAVDREILRYLLVRAES